MFDSIIGLACGVTHVGLDFRLSEMIRRRRIERDRREDRGRLTLTLLL